MTSLVIVHPAEGTAMQRRNRRSRWHRRQIWCRWEDRYSPENWASGSLALAVVRGSCNASAYISSTDRCCRVRGRVLMVQEHQPLPSEPCWQFSLHTALQESLRRFSSEECMPDQRVSYRHILPGDCWH